MSWPFSAFADEAGPSCDEQILALRQAGMRFIDVRGIDHFNISELPLENAKVIRGKLDAAGITVHMFGSPLGKIDVADDFEIDVKKLRHLAALAPVLGCQAVRIFSYYNKKAARPLGEFHAEALRRLHDLARMAQDLGLVLYHENESHIMGDACRDVLTIMRELREKFGGGQGTFRMIFDFGNYNAGHENAWENWLVLRDTTDAIHLKDNTWHAGAGGELQHVPVGQGEGHVEKIMADAVARGWQGPVIVEPHLQHSAAVAATGPSGIANQAYAQMTADECFQIACRAGRELCTRVGAKLT